MIIKTIKAAKAIELNILEVMDYSFKFDVNFICPNCNKSDLTRFRSNKPYDSEGTEEIICKHCKNGKIVFDFNGFQD